MSAVTFTFAAQVATRYFAEAGAAMNASLEKLATGSRINRGSDDAAGLISSEQLSAALAMLEAESRGAERADAAASVADGALAEVSDLLSDAAAAEVAMANTGGMSRAEREAYQMEIDSARRSVERIASTTTFNGQKVLDGSMTLGSGGQSVSVPSTGDLRAAASEVATMRGRIGAFQKNDLAPRMRSMAVEFENTAAAYSAIRDTDYAAETANLARARILRASTAGVLALANSEPRGALNLLA
jgi:flagellin